VLGGQGHVPPSETFGAALIGCGGRGPGTFSDLQRKHGLATRALACCDVDRHRAQAFQKRAGSSCEAYQDFRRVVERKDIEVVAIGTPPHWHALISIACMEAGKDVVCEKPATRFIAEGRALADAERRYGRVYQVGTYGRFGMSRKEDNRQMRKLMTSGLLKPCKGRYVHRGGLKVKQWSGRLDVAPQPVPEYLDWDMYCGPSPIKPFHPPRHGGTHRWYWDYEGGGLGDMGHHKFDPITWLFGKDGTAPVEIEAHAPPATPTRRNSRPCPTRNRASGSARPSRPARRRAATPRPPIAPPASCTWPTSPSAPAGRSASTPSRKSSSATTRPTASPISPCGRPGTCNTESEI